MIRVRKMKPVRSTRKRGHRAVLLTKTRRQQRKVKASA